MGTQRPPPPLPPFNLHKIVSATGKAFDPISSDADFLVEFQPLAEGQHADAYFGLCESLSALLDRPVDLAMTKAIRNRYFLHAIEPSRRLCYAS